MTDPEKNGDNFRPIAEACRSVSQQIAEAAISYAEQQGDHAKAAKLKAVWEAFRDDRNVF